jgi:hypothetical protein
MSRGEHFTLRETGKLKVLDLFSGIGGEYA